MTVVAAHQHGEVTSEHLDAAVHHSHGPVKRGEGRVGLVVSDGTESAVFQFTVLGHNGDFYVKRLKFSSGVNFGEGPFIGQGTEEMTGDGDGYPHGNEDTPGSWLWLDEVQTLPIH